MTKLLGSEALVQILKQEGVEYVFGLPGSTELQFMDSLEAHPEIKYILGLHESVSAAMAEGYARASGKVGVVNLHTFVGLGGAMPLLFNARDGRVPLVVTAGQQDTRVLLQEPVMSGDLLGMGKLFAKLSLEVTNAHDIPLAMRRAFKVATQPPAGPVFVSLPQNIMEESIDFAYSPTPPLSLSRRRPDGESIDRVAKLLVGARNPLLLLGDEVAKHDAMTEAVELAELTGAAVYQMFTPDVDIPATHPQYLGELGFGTQPLKEAFSSVDVLVAVGVPLFVVPFYPSDPVVTEKTRVVQISSDPWEIGKNLPLEAGIDGDVKLSLSALNEALGERMTAEARKAAAERAKKVAVKKAELSASLLERARRERDNIPIAASRLMQELAGALKPGMVLVNDSWSYSVPLRRYIGLTEPKSYYPRNGISIGWGLPAALGVKLACPERPVVAVVGDGSAMFSIQSLWTAAHYKIPVTYVICANASYRLVKLTKFLQMGSGAMHRVMGMNFAEPKIDFCQIARAVGVSGRRVERPDELGDALRSALSLEAPSVVEVAIDGGF